MNRTYRCAYLTMESLEGFYCSDNLTYAPLASLGWTVTEVPWKNPDVRWADFDVVVIRSPWDYFKQPQAFLRVLEHIDRSSARLANPLEIVSWNLDKRYLQELEELGIPIVPTRWLAKLQPADLDAAFEQFATQEIVVKPTIGAGAENTFWLRRNNNSCEATRQALQVFQSRPLMVQPFLHAILERGEYSLFYFGGQFSHCVRKMPKPGDFRVQEEHGGIIRIWPADAALLAAGKRVLDAIDAELLYARVDFVHLSTEELAVIEIELIEPSLYFAYDEQSPVRFAAALDQMYRN
jgi:glutathione synthase/RimK-type ligase-like ATP-grasp enzyme